jgi:hypothetical protein
MRAKRDLVRIRIEISKHVKQQTCARLHVINLLDLKALVLLCEFTQTRRAFSLSHTTVSQVSDPWPPLPGDPASALSLHEAALGPGPTPALERPWRRVSTSWHVSLVS